MNRLYALIAATVGLRLATLGSYPLFDTTEARYAEIGRIMLERGDWVTPFVRLPTGTGYVPFWAKPPLSFWATASSYFLLGVSEFAARLPSFLFMAGVAGLTYLLARQRCERGRSALALAVFCAMPLNFYLAGGVMTDPALAFCTTLSMATFWQAMAGKGRLWGYGFFVSLGLSLLAKGPVGLVVTGLPIGLWVLWNRRWRELWSCLPWVTGGLLTLLIALPWYVVEELRTPGYLHYFIVGEHWQRYLTSGWRGDLYGVGRAQPRGTIWLFAAAAMGPFSLLLLAALARPSTRPALTDPALLRDEWWRYLWLWALSPLVFFTLARNVLIPYVVTSLPALAIITAEALSRLPYGRRATVPLLAVTPALFAMFLLVIQLPSVPVMSKSQATIVAAYRAARGPETGPLIYLGHRPYSADFYTRGGTLLARTVEDARRLTDRPGRYFVGVRSDFYQTLPEDFRQQLQPVVRQNENMLFTLTRT